MSPTDKSDIANLYKNMHANTNTKTIKVEETSDTRTDSTVTNNSTTDDAFRDNLNNLYLSINDSNNSTPSDSTNYTLDTSDKTNTFKTKKILKTEKVLRAIHLQYSDISPSPAKPNTEYDNSINVAYNYKRSVEEEIQNKKSVVKQIKLDRLQSAKETIPENISYVDINEQ